MRQALAEGAPRAAGHFTDSSTAGERAALAQLQADYVELFDLSRKHTLYLSYWTDGDTRRRGEVLADVEAALPPQRLPGRHCAASCRTTCRWCWSTPRWPTRRTGSTCCRSYRASLELIRLSLAERSAAYSAVLQAVCETLPGASPADRQAALAMARSGPPREAVGLDPYDPRLLPIRRECDAMNVLLWGVLPYIALAILIGGTDLALPLRPVRLDHPLLPALRVAAAADRLPAVPLRHPLRPHRPHRRSADPDVVDRGGRSQPRSCTTSMRCWSAASPASARSPES